jgi:hypothetical protein
MTVLLMQKLCGVSWGDDTDSGLCHRCQFCERFMSCVTTCKLKHCLSTGPRLTIVHENRGRTFTSEPRSHNWIKPTAECSLAEVTLVTRRELKLYCFLC